MLSLKEFKEFSLEANHQKNTVGGQCECITSQDIFVWQTDTGELVEIYGYNDDGDILKHEFYLKGVLYDGTQGAEK